MNKFLAVLITSFAGLSSTGQNSVSKQLDKYFSALYSERQFNGNVLVAENGKIIYERCFGFADFSADKPNTKNTSFPVASITKTFTSTAILQLQEKGRLDIHDQFIKYFPDFPYDSVTVKQLLSHTSRLPSFSFYRLMDTIRQKKDTFFTNNDVIPLLIDLKKPLLDHGTGIQKDFSYSNLNYYLLALLIEKLSGMPFGSYIRKYIFMPARMEHSSLSEFYFGLDNNLCREQKYRYLFSTVPDRIDTMAEYSKIFTTYNFKGHGDLVSTIRDLLKYDEALYNGNLLKESSLHLAYDPVVPGDPDISGYALGWSIAHDSSGGKVVRHHGGGIGIQTMLIRNIKKRQTVILFDNTNNYSFTMAMDAMKILNNEKILLPRKSIAKLYGRTIVEKGIPAAKSLLDKLKKDSLNYSLSEYEMNLLAYQLMWNNMDDLAFEIFKTDLELFPGSWNVYDSYAEILLKMGKREEAIRMYEKSIRLNPKNENGKKMLDQILKQK